MSEVTGLPVIPSVYPGRFSYLGQPDPWRHEVILHLVSAEKGPEPNRSHVDIEVAAVVDASGAGEGGDHHWRVTAGRTAP